MEEVKQKRTCSQCGIEKENSFCDFCKTDTPSNLNVSVSDKIKVRDRLRIRKLGIRTKKYLSEYWGGWFPSGDSKLPDGVDKSQTVDREKNEYHKVVKKHGTDEILREAHEPLSEHQNKGT